PEDHLRLPQLRRREATGRLVRVVQNAVVEVEPQIAEGRVAAEVLVGQEQHPLAPIEGPREGPLGVRRRAYHAGVAADEGLDRGGRIHVRDWYGRVHDIGVGEYVPRRLHL